MSEDIKQIIVVRKDLKMRKGKLAAQVAHASLAIFFDRGNLSINDEFVIKDKFIINDVNIPMQKWIKGAFTKIVVGCNSEKELLNIYKQAKERGIPCSLIKDAGLTEFKEPTYTCVGLGPEYSEFIDKITGNLKLL